MIFFGSQKFSFYNQRCENEKKRQVIKGGWITKFMQISLLLIWHPPPKKWLMTWEEGELIILKVFFRTQFVSMGQCSFLHLPSFHRCRRNLCVWMKCTRKMQLTTYCRIAVSWERRENESEKKFSSISIFIHLLSQPINQTDAFKLI
jgi:hypothetical protein